jgi:putative sigma-54 modulation protein
MTVEEAVQEVDTSNSEFIVFRNAESERVSVVYRRRDGNFGLIEP